MTVDTSDNSTFSLIDAVDRFERMVDIQIETVTDIDSKAEHLSRLIAILLGVILAAASVIPEFDGLEAGVSSGPVLSTLIFGVGALLVSLSISIITYLSSNVDFGPKEGVAEYFASVDVSQTEYTEIFLRGYADALANNERIMEVARLKPRPSGRGYS